MNQLNGTTIHHGWILSGYGSRGTAELDFMADLDRKYKAGEIGFDEVILNTKKLDIKFIYLFDERYVEDFKKIRDKKGYQIVYSRPEGALLGLMNIH